MQTQMAERSLSYSNPLGRVTLEEQIQHAQARARKALFLANLHPDDRAYVAARDARICELRTLEALRPSSRVKRKRGRGCL